MANFIGVIKKAVESLPDNTPEARARIYDRARMTIKRQVDALPEGANLKIYDAQLEKVEAAILEIESQLAGQSAESATAQPVTPDIAEPTPVAAPEPTPAPSPEPIPEPVAEPETKPQDQDAVVDQSSSDEQSNNFEPSQPEAPVSPPDSTPPSLSLIHI